MRVNVAIPEAHVSAPVLNSALEAVTRLDESMIRGGDVAPFNPDNPGVKWKPEPPGQEHFDHATMVRGRGWGDCDDLAPWRAASLRVTGEDPGARAVVKRSGDKRWHAVVRRSDGSIDDPSIDAGMPSRGRGVGVVGAAVPFMLSGSSEVGTYIMRPQLALRPVRDRLGQVEAWQARADLPWHWSSKKSPGEIAMASLHASPVSSQAVVGACHGAVALGEAAGGASEHDLDRLAAIADACDGADWRELAGIYGPEHADAATHIVGSFFGNIWKKVKRTAKKAVRDPFGTAFDMSTQMMPGASMLKPYARKFAMPIASKALQFIPGVGPIASMAFDAAAPHLQRMVARGGHMRPSQRRAQRMPQGYGMHHGYGMQQYGMPQYGMQQMPWFPNPYSFR